MSLRGSAYSAGRWTTASAISRAGLQVLQTLILARILAPADFGLMAMATAALAVGAMFMDLGVSNALVHFPRPSSSVLSTLYWLNLLSSIGCMLLFGLIAWPLAQAYQQPELTKLMATMSLAFPLNALGQQFRSLAEKELRFSALATIEMMAALCGFIAGLGAAMADFGVYALAASLLTMAATSSAMAWAFLSHDSRPQWVFQPGKARHYLRYGAYRIGDSLFNTLSTQADLLIAGFFGSPTAVGAYSVPRDFNLRTANSVVNPIATRIGLPLMAKVQHDHAAIRSIYLQTLRMTASLNFPLYVAIIVWAPEITGVLLGKQWEGAVFYMRIFAAWGLIRSTGNPVGSLLYATGSVRRAFWWNLAQLMVAPPILWLGAHVNGLIGLAWTMVGLQLGILLPLWRWLVFPASGATLRQYLSQLGPPLVASLAAGTVGALASLSLSSAWLRLGIGLSAMAVAYLLISRLLNPAWVRAVTELLRPFANRQHTNTPR